MARAVCVLLLLASASVAHSRSLAATKPNPKTKPATTKKPTAAVCSSKIPSCVAGKCDYQGVNVVCSQCKDTYIKATNGLQCVCRQGTYEVCTGRSCSCKQCEQAFYCTGGSKTAKNSAAATLRGVRRSCHQQLVDQKSTTADVEANGVTTTKTGATSPADCVPLSGYMMPVGANQAVPCPVNTWSAGGDRSSACNSCQHGLEEDPANPPNFTRSSQAAVCLVPSGMYLDTESGWTWNCTVGTFKGGYLPADSDGAKSCFSCPKGTTTKQEGSVSMSQCNQILPGYNINAEMIATQGVDGQLDTQDTRCPKGTFFPGGDLPSPGVSTCQPCPLGTTTQDLGATSDSFCMVPPGYYINTLAGRLAKCPTAILGMGYYRDNWATWNDTSVQDTDGTKSCTPCGVGILSALTDLDAMDPTNVSLVATSSESCYIEAGWGMTQVQDSNNEFTAAICANGTYSASPERSYGLWEQPCLKCFPYQITLKLGATNHSDCTNAAGWGVIAPDGSVMACGRGSWNPAGSNTGCTPCATGRTTTLNPEDPDTNQDSPDDCVLQEGWGILDNATTTGTPDDVNLPVVPCPNGTYSPGGAIDTRCISCSDGYTTPKPGIAGTDNSACRKCAPGLGRVDPNSAFTCQTCNYGYYQIGYNGWDGLNHAGDGEICLQCPTTKYAYVSSKGKDVSDLLDSEGITLQRGAPSLDNCTPRLSQQFVHAGQTWGLPGSVFTSTAKLSVLDCAAACRPQTDNGVACFAEYDYASQQCRIGTMPPATDSTQAKIMVKLIPSGIVSGMISAVGAVGQGSQQGSFMDSGFIGAVSGSKTGMYRHLDISGFSPADQANMGVALQDTQGNLMSLQVTDDASLVSCAATCDAAQECWAITIIGGTCTLRTGGIKLDVRSFYTNPKPGSVPGF